jgi:transcription antitermination factor NusG
VSQPEIQWFACHTRPRCEKKFAALLAAENWEHYLPLVEKKHRYGTRDRVHTRPLFTGYVFAKIPLEDKARAYQQQLIVRTLPVLDEPVFLAQIESVRALIASGIEFTLKPLLKRGTKVRVISGPLYGTLATVEDPAKNAGIIVSMDILQQGLLVPIALENLEILP